MCEALNGFENGSDKVIKKFSYFQETINNVRYNSQLGNKVVQFILYLRECGGPLIS